MPHVREALGNIGVWTSSRQWPSDPGGVGKAAAELEALGYGAVWLGSSTDDLALPRTLLDATSSLVVATGIVDIWTSDPVTLAANHRRLATAHPGRFLLGLGMGHAQLVEPATGQTYTKPLSRMNAFLDDLDGATPPVPVDQRVLAALGPRALELAAARSFGAHPYLVTPEHTSQARSVLGVRSLLAPEQKVFIGTNADGARAVGRQRLAIYLGLPNYLRNLRMFGFDDDDFADGGSDRFVDEMVAWGSADVVVERVKAHLDAGADHVAVQVLSSDKRPVLPIAEWRAFAEAALTPTS